MTETVTIPNPPASEADDVLLLQVGGLKCIKPAVNHLETLPEYVNNPHKALLLKTAHTLLNVAGYLLEYLTNQPEGAYGAGGGGKPGW